MLLMHLLAHLPNILANELRNLTTKGDGSKKRATHDVTPYYVTAPIRWRRLAAWHFSWQTAFYI
jgi:hypothetical protein